MPKIIKNARAELLAEARRQIAGRGYAATTVRSVAAACGVAVGTVYNYFPSKEMLIATFVAEDWAACTAALGEQPPGTAEETLRRVYTLLCDFAAAHRALFTDADAAKAFSAIFAVRHKQLRGQIAAFLLPLCEKADDSAFRADFLAEALLTWTTAGVPFERLCPVLLPLVDQ